MPTPHHCEVCYATFQGHDPAVVLRAHRRDPTAQELAHMANVAARLWAERTWRWDRDNPSHFSIIAV